MNHFQMQAPLLSKANKLIIIVYVATFVLNSVMGLAGEFSLAKLLGLSLQGMSSGLIYQLITFPFIETSLMSVIFHSLLIWFIGSDLETRWGQTFYLKFLALSVFASGVVYLIVSALASQVFNAVPIMGLGGVVFSLLMAYGIIFSDRQLSFMLIFPMKAKYFCLLLAGIELYMGIFSPHGKAAWAHLAAGAVGFAYLKAKSMRARGQKLFASPLKKRKSAKSHLKIVDPSDQRESSSNDPKYWQ